MAFSPLVRGCALAALLSLACASKVLVPPRVDLGGFGTLGMIDFASQGSPELGRLAGQEFLASVQSAQPGVPVLELGERDRVLGSVQRDSLDPEAIRALGERYGVDAILAGELDAEEVKPNLSLDSVVRSLRMSAEVEGSLRARIFDTNSGATLWTNSARARETVARADVSGTGLPRVGATDPDDARQRLVRRLVAGVTADFWSRYE